MNLTGQTDSTNITLDNGVYTFIHYKYDTDGREISKTTEYIDSVDFAARLFNDASGNDNALKSTEDLLAENNLKFNIAKNNYKVITGESYSTAVSRLYRPGLSGNWKLIVGDSTYQVYTTPANTILRNADNSKRMKVSFTRNKLLKISTAGNNTPFFVGSAILEERYNNKGKIFYVGKADNGDKLRLRR